MSFRSVLGGLALTALTSLVAGCGDDTNVTTTSVTDNGQTIRVIGRVLNAQTLVPAAGATIEICGITVGYSDASGAFVIDVPGNITSNNDGSYTSTLMIKISANGMATIITQAGFDNDETPEDTSRSVEQDPGLNSMSVMDLGTIQMNTGFDQKIVVTKNGTPLAGVRVAVTSNNFLNVSVGTSGTIGETCMEDQAATTGADGIAIFKFLDPFRTYRVIVPSQNTDAVDTDGFDFGTESETFTVQGSGAVFALDVDDSSFFTGNVSITDDSATDFASINIDRGVISTVTSSGTILLNSLDGNGVQQTTTALNFSLDNVADRGFSGVDGDSEGYGEYITNATGAVTLVFQNPVHVVQGTAGREVSFRYFDNMIDPANAGFNKLHVVSGTATSLTSALGTVWTFTPNATLPLYTPYTVEGFAHNEADPGRTGFINRTYLRIPGGHTSVIDVKADNYNGTTGGNGGDDRVFLDFDRIVHGTYHIIEIVDDNAVQSFGANGNSQSITNELRAIVNNVGVATGTTDLGNLGVSPGIRYRVNARGGPGNNSTFLGDNRAGTANSIRVAIVAEDIDGNALNALDTILDLPVR